MHSPSQLPRLPLTWPVKAVWNRYKVWRWKKVMAVHPHLSPPVAHATHEFVGSNVAPFAVVPTPLRTTKYGWRQDLLWMDLHWHCTFFLCNFHSFRTASRARSISCISHKSSANGPKANESSPRPKQSPNEGAQIRSLAPRYPSTFVRWLGLTDLS